MASLHVTAVELRRYLSINCLYLNHFGSGGVGKLVFSSTLRKRAIVIPQETEQEINSTVRIVDEHSDMLHEIDPYLSHNDHLLNTEYAPSAVSILCASAASEMTDKSSGER
jgi:hypothetical protein